MPLIQMLIDKNAIVQADDPFVVNDIMPIAINDANAEDHNPTILFYLHQDIYDKFMYIKIPIQIDMNRVRKKKYYTENIKKNFDQYKTFLELTRDMRIENLYTSDFDSVPIDKKPYYKFQSIRNIGRGIYNRIPIEITRWNWILLNLFFDELFFSLKWRSEIFSEESWIKHKFVLIDHVEYLAASRQLYKRLNQHVIVHNYRVGCGREQYRFNWITEDSCPGKKLRKNLNYDTFEIENKQFPVISDIVYDKIQDLLYMILPESDRKIVLILKRDILDQTNFMVSDNKVYEGE